MVPFLKFSLINEVRFCVTWHRKSLILYVYIVMTFLSVPFIGSIPRNIFIYLTVQLREGGFLYSKFQCTYGTK